MKKVGNTRTEWACPQLEILHPPGGSKIFQSVGAVEDSRGRYHFPGRIVRHDTRPGFPDSAVNTAGRRSAVGFGVGGPS
jgi:hypothetical protein